MANNILFAPISLHMAVKSCRVAFSVKSRIIVLVLFVSVLQATTLIAQEETRLKNTQVGIHSAAALSFAGYTTSAGLFVRTSHSMFLAAFHTNLSDLVHLGTTHYGVMSAYRYYPATITDRFRLFVGPVVSFLSQKKYRDADGEKAGWLMETAIEYGFDLKIFPFLSIGNSVGFGGFYEKYGGDSEYGSGIVHGLNAKAAIHLQIKLTK